MDCIVPSTFGFVEVCEVPDAIKSCDATITNEEKGEINPNCLPLFSKYSTIHVHINLFKLNSKLLVTLFRKSQRIVFTHFIFFKGSRVGTYGHILLLCPSQRFEQGKKSAKMTFGDKSEDSPDKN